MSFKINLSKGFDIKLRGEAVKTITTIKAPSSFAIKPNDFIGITRPKLLNNVGDEVKAGTPILFDKLSDQIMYCSPVSGEIIEVVRGLKRRIEEIRILPDKKNIYVKMFFLIVFFCGFKPGLQDAGITIQIPVSCRTPRVC